MRTSSLDERGNLDAPPGSHPWAVAMRREIQFALGEAKTNSEHLQNLLRLFEEHHGYQELQDQRGKKFRNYEAFCTCKYPWGLGYRTGDIERILAERRSAEAKAEAAIPIREHRRPTREEQENKVDNVNFNGVGGNSADYLTARIARDRPDILERMKLGEFPSVRAAGREAGIVKDRLSIPKAPQAAGRLLARHFTPAQFDALVQAAMDAYGVPGPRHP